MNLFQITGGNHKQAKAMSKGYVTLPGQTSIKPRRPSSARFGDARDNRDPKGSDRSTMPRRERGEHNKSGYQKAA